MKKERSLTIRVIAFVVVYAPHLGLIAAATAFLSLPFTH